MRFRRLPSSKVLHCLQVGILLVLITSFSIIQQKLADLLSHLCPAQQLVL